MPPTKYGNVTYVDEYPAHIILGRQTLAYQGRSFKENTMPGQIRALYLQWCDISKTLSQDWARFRWDIFAKEIADEIHKMLVNSAKEPTIRFCKSIYSTLKEKVEEYQLSAVGRIIARYRDEMLFTSPSKESAEKFLDECLYDSRLVAIRKSLENYINGETDLIIDL